MDPESSQNISDAREAPVLEPGHTLATVTDKISSIVLGRGTTKGWIIGFGISFALLMLFNVAVTYLLVKGVGIWGIRIPIAWGFAIVNFVWWIGIGHAGTLISAILLLLHQKWRTSINRFAEAMTIFAVACAGMFPLLHMGRPWMFYYLHALSERHVDVAAVSQSACLGRLRSVHVCHGIATVLVRRNDSRLSYPSRSGEESRGTSYLWLPGDGLARIRCALVAI